MYGRKVSEKTACIQKMKQNAKNIKRSSFKTEKKEGVEADQRVFWSKKECVDRL